MRSDLLPKDELKFPDRRSALRLLKAVEAELLSIDRYFRTVGRANACPMRASELRIRRDRLIRYSHALCHCSIYPASNRA